MNINKLKTNLKWFFNDSEAALGLHTNYYIILNTAYGATPHTDNDSLIGSLPKVRKHRQIYQALLSLSRIEIRYLSALYLDEYNNKYPLIIKNVFKEKTGLAFCLSCLPMKELLDLCVKFRHKSLSPAEERTINKLIRLTEDQYSKLHKFLQYNHYIMELDK